MAGLEAWGEGATAEAAGSSACARGWSTRSSTGATSTRSTCRSPTRSSTRCTSAASPATRAPGVAHPGTYRGVIEKIPYLRELGVTAVELMPVTEFEEGDNPRSNPLTGEPLRNFWGYQPVSFFAPKASYAPRPAPAARRCASSRRW